MKSVYPQGSLGGVGRPKRLPAKLRKHLTAIAHEVTWLNHYHEIFLQFTEVVKQSPVQEEKSVFWDFSKWALIGELVHRVDRICEGQWASKKRKVNSLGAFLDDIVPYAHLINRSSYVGAVPNTLTAFRKRHPRKDDPYIPADEFYRLNREMDRLIGKTKFALSESQVR